MTIRLEVGTRPDLADTQGARVVRKIRAELGIPVKRVHTIKVFTIQGLSETQGQDVLDKALLHDPVLHQASLQPLGAGMDWAIEVGFRPGVTDNEGRTARETLALALHGLPVVVSTATQYLIWGELTRQQVEHIARDLLANELIHRVRIKSADQWQEAPGFAPLMAAVLAESSGTVRTIPLDGLDDEALMELSRSRTLALNRTEMRRIAEYFRDPQVRAQRAALGLPPAPTDAELECLAQTWSEHCKHKIFSARIHYFDTTTGQRATINSLYKTYIQATTATIRKAKGPADLCLSVFTDNAGVIRFDHDTSLCIKVETHNSPSALDPYGGALTGIVGVNRDPMGTGLGAKLLCNTDVFCFASPFFSGELPPRLLHPRRIFEGVREGVEHGGNKSGVPTVNGAIVFHERFLGKPLVFCGTVGMIPAQVAGRPGHTKQAQVGDHIVMVGGRIGKDGIHGATFSSEELHEGSPATAVQIGDPITQRKMYDFLLRARDLGLSNAITDNGAGGLSSSVGEMAQDTGGCQMDLDRAPLKYPGLDPWEILVSEAQERMTVAVPPEHLDAFLSLAEEMDVEATALGTFTDSGYFLVRHGEEIVAALDMEFLHHGTPQMELTAVWQPPHKPAIPAALPPVEDHGRLVCTMLGRLNICSREYVIRQYDHEVQGGSVIKPLMGHGGPTDAAVLRPKLDSLRGAVIACGICPKLSDLDTYWMTAAAIDEAIRNAVAVGADPEQLVGVDNFCWCDPVASDKNPDGPFKLAQLVRSARALAHFCQAYGVPCVSGKDSMKNDYTGGGIKISIPPTVLFTALGILPDVTRAVSSDFKTAGEILYVLGLTRGELGGSELADVLGIGGDVPHVDVLSAKNRYQRLFAAIRDGLISACHDVSDGGIAVAVAEMALGGGLGAVLEAEAIPQRGCPDLATLLYSETPSRLLVTVPRQHQRAFEALCGGDAAPIGETLTAPQLTFRHQGRLVANLGLTTLRQAWEAPLNFGAAAS
jgi:phosphoribosylformylglycinamidine synthase II